MRAFKFPTCVALGNVACAVYLLGIDARGLTLLSREDDQDLHRRATFVGRLVPVVDVLDEGLSRFVLPRLSALGLHGDRALEHVDEDGHRVLMQGRASAGLELADYRDDLCLPRLRVLHGHVAGGLAALEHRGDLEALRQRLIFAGGLGPLRGGPLLSRGGGGPGEAGDASNQQAFHHGKAPLVVRLRIGFDPRGWTIAGRVDRVKREGEGRACRNAPKPGCPGPQGPNDGGRAEEGSDVSYGLAWTRVRTPRSDFR